MPDGPKWILEETMSQPERDRLSVFLNSLNEAVIGIDKDGNIEMANSGAMALLDVHKLQGQAVDQTIQLIGKNGQPTGLLAVLKSIGKGFATTDYSLKMPDGNTRRIYLSGGPAKSQKQRYDGGYVVLFRPISG